MSIITYENLRSFAYTNDTRIQGKIRGICVSFMGLNGNVMFAEDPAEGIRFAQEGIVFVIPYVNPWAWMNDHAVHTTDEILLAIEKHYRLSELPVCSSGGSMGGQSAIVYCAYSQRNIAACVANCPVCDMPYHFTERPDLPRTMYSVFGAEPDFQQALRTHSPLHLTEQLPQIPFTIFHCEKDLSVNKERHSDRFVEKLKQTKASVQYISVPERGHCDLPEEYKERYHQAVLKTFD